MYDKEKVKEALELCSDIETFYENKEGGNNISQSGLPPMEYRHESLPEESGSTYSPEEKEYTPVIMPDSQKPSENMVKSGLSRFLTWAGSILVCFFIAYGAARLVTDYIIQVTVVEGISMEDTLLDRDILVVDKLSYRLHEPERFDIVIFPYAMDDYYVKRVIGLPGETICVKDGSIYINGQRLLEEFGMEEIDDPGIAGEPVLLGENEYFLLGDNRNNSKDSRSQYVGPVSRDMIKGKVWMRVYPFDTIKKFK